MNTQCKKKLSLKMHKLSFVMPTTLISRIDPSGEHGIEPPLPPIPARAVRLFRFSGETEPRLGFFGKSKE